MHVFGQHLNMLLRDVEETATTVETDNEIMKGYIGHQNGLSQYSLGKCCYIGPPFLGLLLRSLRVG